MSAQSLCHFYVSRENGRRVFSGVQMASCPGSRLHPVGLVGRNSFSCAWQLQCRHEFLHTTLSWVPCFCILWVVVVPFLFLSHKGWDSSSQARSNFLQRLERLSCRTDSSNQLIFQVTIRTDGLSTMAHLQLTNKGREMPLR